MAVRRQKLIATNSTMIDPLNAGSAITYVIGEGTRGPWADVHLCDCDRKITWHFYRHTSADKIDKALEILEEFRDKLKAAKATYKKSRTRKLKAKNARTA